MVDHLSMRDALDRALNHEKNQYCNSCKNPYLVDSGGYTNLVTYDKVYNIWYCQTCFFTDED